MGTLFQTLSLYVLAFLGFSTIFLGLFRTELVVGIPLFYRGCLFAVLASVTALLTLGGVSAWLRSSGRGRLGLPAESIISAVVLSASIHLVFFVVVPVTVDRSVTMFLLARMAAADSDGTPLAKNDLERLLEAEYVKKYDAVGRRLNEQLLSGNVEALPGGHFALTVQGSAFLDFAEAVSRAYGVFPIYRSQLPIATSLGLATER